jgi:hypothetical protein
MADVYSIVAVLIGEIKENGGFFRRGGLGMTEDKNA